MIEYFGGRGYGKTASMKHWLDKAQTEGKTVYANFTLEGSNLYTLEDFRNDTMPNGIARVWENSDRSPYGLQGSVRGAHGL
jgi:hypothetical protein